jgi:hypothetical protein
MERLINKKVKVLLNKKISESDYLLIDTYSNNGFKIVVLLNLNSSDNELIHVPALKIVKLVEDEE